MSSTNGDSDEHRNEKELIVRLRGLPWSVTEAEIIRWFGDKIKVRDGEDGVHLTLSREGRPSGEAYVEFDCEPDYKKALKKHQDHMGHRYIEVFHASKKEMDWKLEKSGVDSDEVMTDCCIRMRGIPYQCSKEEILGFFSGLEIVPNGIHLMTDVEGRSIGEAYVQFADKETAERSLLKHKEKMGSRYIEIFRSSAQERQAALGKMRQTMYKSTRPGPYDRFGGPPGGSRFMGGRGMGGEWGNSRFNSPMSDFYTGGGMSRNYSEYCPQVLMRGLPYRANEEDIAEFFYPVHPVDIHLMYDDQGRSSGEAFVEFSCLKDVERAMTKNCAKMGYRYIELFPDPTSRQRFDDSPGMGNRGDGWGGGRGGRNNWGGGGRGGSWGSSW